MPILTFYAYLGSRHTRTPIKTVDDYPTDWQHLREQLKEVAVILHTKHKATNEVLLTLEQHLPGKFAWATLPGHYSPTRIRFRREVQFAGELSYHPKSQLIDLRNCTFGPQLMFLAGDYYAERGIRYRVAPVIPRMHQRILGNPKTLIMEPSGMRYADYSTRLKPCYGAKDEDEKRHVRYQLARTREYLPENLKVREEQSSEQH